MKATKQRAQVDIKFGDYEPMFRASRNDKRRICIFCNELIPKGIDYYKHFEYPYEPNQKRWFACKGCFYMMIAK